MKAWGEMTSRERDALVAEKVMGWKVVPYASDYDGWGEVWNALDAANGDDPVGVAYPEGLRIGMGAYDIEDGTMQPWEPSTDIAAAWEVVEKMQERGVLVEVGSRVSKVSGWYAIILPENFEACSECEAPYDPPYSLAPTAPEAICLAALRAMGVDA